jgi:hypothetical protein
MGMRWENSTPCCMISLMKHSYRIGLFAKQSRSSTPVLSTLQKLIHFLKQKGVQLILEKHTASLGVDLTLPVVELEERRFLLEATIQRQGREIAKTRALNDVVLHSNHYARMIDFEIYINKQIGME